MIVKGHDFPNVTLVGILAADLSLYSSDFRCGERTCQLLTQAAGRAGRDNLPGERCIRDRKYKVPIVVTLNSFVSDTEAEYAFIKQFCEEKGCEFALSEVWAKGGEGGEALAQKVIETLDTKESRYEALYPDEMSLKDKIKTVATEIYGADGVSYAPAAEKALARIEEMGFGTFPVCMAKTQYSLSDDQTKLGRPTGFTVNVRDVYVSAGAGFVVVLTGAIMTMPGLPKKPAAEGIDVNAQGVITGLF